MGRMGVPPLGRGTYLILRDHHLAEVGAVPPEKPDVGLAQISLEEPA
jgi:hypothetical protein